MAKRLSLLLLRVSLGGLLLVWGVNKVVNIDHSMAIAENFYFGLLAAETWLPVAGVVQMAVGLLIIAGFARRWVYPIQLLLNGVSLAAVIASVIDPWGWFLEGTNALFYPSLIIFAGSLVVMAFADQDQLALDARKAPAPVSWKARRDCGQ
ncbi:Uncharacterized membrane protein YphA, DoxX/SURF4 family [Franzmannia pantelleriensis]|uniref:Uncharacterized membrane protein YphA, DoxX/SURF4 family n=1 Tax=Franzmannia pantelleriensis TaxID=48727 RepID=A0A1G9JK13_9GAMM|nr:DoxX family protein [Halomonas pantelleriensis]SDL37586.1 Uncharacterized membrane protein YphA, DoxX/SURF4 family [Halomonas pantelleriensis]